jgi:class 3 adenylate cyclase/pimeloyl-ACP methyl ester carboxylesterase
LGAELRVVVVRAAAGGTDVHTQSVRERSVLGSRSGTGDTTAVVSEVRYARSGDVNIAYRVAGHGPFDVVFVPGAASHAELAWELPFGRALFERIASFARLIHFDKRGTGMSDPADAGTPLEVRMDDVRAVIDAVGSRRAAIFGVSEGAPMSILFAATYPDRAWALVLDGAYARELWAHDYPWGTPEAEYVAALTRMHQAPHDQAAFEREAREASPNATEAEVAALARYFRLAASPGAFRSLARMNMEIDVRHVLPAIRIPTLVLHHSGDPWVSVEQGHYVAEQIPGATYVELPGDMHIASLVDLPPYLEEIERFLNRVWEAAPHEEIEPDRVLATVLFTDIVGASERAVALGDRAWREVLERHHELVRRQLLRFRGAEVDTAGDGFFASFDGPARAIRCACSIAEGVRELGVEVRAGLHTGECEVVDGKVAGIAVHTGARVAAQAQAGEVLVSSTVKDLVAGSAIAFADRGRVELKGIPGEWQLFAVAGEQR